MIVLGLVLGLGLVGTVILALAVATIVVILFCYTVKKWKEDKTLTKISLFLFFSFILPLIFQCFSLYDTGKLFSDSDVLGYYGAVIGCTITVWGIHWTFNNEKEVAAEGRRNDSLPILNFELKNTYDVDKSYDVDESYDVDKSYDLIFIRKIDTYEDYKALKSNEKKLDEELSNLYNKQGNILDKVREKKSFDPYEREIEDNQKSIKETKKNKDKNSESLSEIFFNKSTFFLNINNIGLQTAILSSISLCSKNDITSKVGVYHENNRVVDNTAKIEIFAVTKEKKLNLNINFLYYDVRSNIESKMGKKEYYDGGDYISIDFTDVYQNKYRYKLPIQLIKVNGNYSVHMDHKRVPVLPEIIEKSSS